MKGSATLLATAAVLATSAGGADNPVPVPEGNAATPTGERVPSARGHKGWNSRGYAGPNQRQRRKRERQTGRR